MAKNNDKKTVRREGTLDVLNMKVNYFDSDNESWYEFDLKEPFEQYHGQDVVITIQFDTVARPQKETTVSGEVIQ